MDGALPVIVNARAGGGLSDEAIAKLVQAFGKVGAKVEVLLPATGAEVPAIARRASDAGHGVVVAAGGDGTVSAVAGALAGTPSALGVVALGTLNHFARDLGMPLDVDEAAKAIVHGRELRIDVAEVNGRVFVNNSSIGLYPTFVLHRKQKERLGSGRMQAFAWALLRVIARYPLLDLRLCLEKAVDVRRTPLVFIGNNVYGMEGFDIGKRERLDAARLCIYVTQRRSRFALFALAARALVGRIRQANDFEALTAQQVTIASRHRRLAVSTDGEVSIMEMPLEYAVRPGALAVRLPPDG